MGSLELLSHFWSLNTILVVQLENFDFGGLSHPLILIEPGIISSSKVFEIPPESLVGCFQKVILSYVRICLDTTVSVSKCNHTCAQAEIK